MANEFPSKFKKPEESPGFLLWQVSSIWQRRQRDALAQIGLTHVQFVLLTVLFWLETHQKKISQTILANFAKTDRMMTSQVVRRLVTKGFMRRLPDPDDSRANVLSITEKGRDIVKEALKIVEGVDQQFFGPIDDEQRQLCLLLSKLSHY